MRIFINALSLSNAYGIGRYTRALLQGLERVDRRGFEICLYLRHGDEKPFAASRAFRFFHPITAHANRLFLEQVELPTVTSRLMPRVFFSPDFTLPAVCKARARIVTVHDLLVYSHPDSVSLRARMLYRTFLPHAIDNAYLIFADSEATKRALHERFPHAALKTIVVYPALDASFVYGCDDAPSGGHSGSGDSEAASANRIVLPFILHVGSFSSRKNVRALANSFAQLRERMKLKETLVFAGGDGTMHMPQNGILDIGFQSDEAIRRLYLSAVGLAMISQCEGFGYPVAEALACGCPVLTTKNSAMSEISPDGRGVIEIDPNDDNEIQAGLTRLMDENAQLRAQIDAKAIRERFSPARFANEFLDVCSAPIA